MITNDTNNINSTTIDEHCYRISPTISFVLFWEKPHLFIYSFVPFLVMITFNSLLVIKILRKTNSSSLSAKKHREKIRLTTSLIVISISFILMTLPGSILFGFFEVDPNSFTFSFYKIFDFFGFLNRASLFLNCFTTNLKFRKTFIKLFIFFKKKENIHGNFALSILTTKNNN